MGLTKVLYILLEILIEINRKNFLIKLKSSLEVKELVLSMTQVVDLVVSQL